MKIENLLPLLIIWIIWRILTSKRKTVKEKAGTPPVFGHKESGKVEPIPAVTALPSASMSDTETKEPIVTKTVAPPPARPGRRVRQTMLRSDRATLQRAVVWAEILAPPVSQRDNF